MHTRLRGLLDDLHRRGVEHDAGATDRLARLRNVDPDTAALLALLVRATGARRVLELGTSNGYSTVWLADAVAANEGPAYPRYWPDLVRVLRPRGVLAVDNVLSHADEVAAFRALVSADERVSEALSPTGAGALLVLREADGRAPR
jgi:predicted O-methyltransferase YrrM